jgi:uncharacterized membrane protein YkoI
MKRSFMVCMVLTGLTWGMSPAWALFEEDKSELLKGTKITLVEAVEKALTNVQGRAVEAELEKEKGNTVFEIKIVDDAGTIREVYVDAQSGNVLKVEKD